MSQSAELSGPRPERLTNIAIPILLVHLAALLAFIPDFVNWTNFVVLVVCTLVFGQGINLGYHRLLTHRSLKVPKWLEYFYVTLALCCLEESPGKWVSSHRRHHNSADEADDPHSPTTSLFWSHMGWLLISRHGKYELASERRYAADILSDPWYAALEQHRWLPSIVYLVHAAVFYLASFGMLWWSGDQTAAWDALGIFLWGVVLRTVVIWHITWSVNSLGHRFGYRSYDTAEGSRNNWLVALLSSGEGWHNNHHHDSASATVQHQWWEIDLTYYHIRLLQVLGLATHVVLPRHIRQRR